MEVEVLPSALSSLSYIARVVHLNVYPQKVQSPGPRITC